MPIEDLRAGDYDDIDESTIEVHEARPLRGDEVTAVISVPLTHDQARALDSVAEHEGKTIFEAARDAIDAYTTARQRAPVRRRAPAPRRAAG